MKKFTFVTCLLTVLVAFSNNDVFGQYVWTKSPSPVLTSAPLGSWYKCVAVPSILYNPDSLRYEMWFTAAPGPENDWVPYQIAHAVSQDGLSWKLVGSGPVLQAVPNTWEANVSCSSVLREDGVYKMWYTANRAWSSGDSAYVAYATSVDGINWTKYENNPVLKPGPAAWEYNRVDDVYVIHSGDQYQMYYDAGPLSSSSIGRIGRATSADGIHWVKDSVNNPVLDMGNGSQWDNAVFLPRIFSIEDTMFMCYTTFWGEVKLIGLALSTDGGTVWQKCGTGPILTKGPEGSWDMTWVQDGAVLMIGDKLHMWYTGYSNFLNRISIGHATMPVDTLIKYTKDPGTGINKSGNALMPKGYSLAQNYPNPFNPLTTITYELSVTSTVDVSIYNLLGQKVATLVSKQQPAGRYSVTWDATGFASGLYFCRLETKGYGETKKLILMK